MIDQLLRPVKKIFRNVRVEVAQKAYGEIFKGEKVLIIGGNSGIGLATAQKCVLEGAYVVITGSSESKCKKAVEQLGKQNASYRILDLNNTMTIPSIMEDLYIEHGCFRYLVYNAGIYLNERNMFSVTEDIWDQYMNVNLKSAFFVCKYFVGECLKKKLEGTIVLTSSDWVLKGYGASRPYAISKSGINAVVRGITKEFYRYGIRANGVAPGETATDMNGINPKGNMYSDVSSGRNFLAEEMAEVIFFLLSDASKCISGEIIPCNGGGAI